MVIFLKSKADFLFLVMILLPLICFSQSFKIEQLTINEGLSNNIIQCIIQDKNGFLWIGTENGLNRYDGYSFKIFKHDPTDPQSISHNYIRCLYEDPADSGNVLWIGTWGGGLNRYDAQTETFTRFMHHPDDTTSISCKPLPALTRLAN
jgi:ligand-binding sensor domain-containing protein